MNFCGVTRFTLLLSPRAAVLMLVNSNDIETSWILPYNSPQFFETLLGALKRYPFYPLKIVVETTQLDIRMADLPPVSPWARKSIMQRQGAHYFPKAELETARCVHDKTTGIWKAFYAASDEEPWLQAVFDRIRHVMNPIEPLSFFATEWFDCAGQVSVMPKTGWAFVNVLCESFGLRQMVFKEGKLVFTRSHVECVPNLGIHELTPRIAAHIREMRDYLPRIDAALADVNPRLYVADYLQDIGAEPSIAALNVQVIAIATPTVETVPPEWSADIAWLHVVARAKHAAMPIDPPWLRQRRDGGMKKQIALWVLIVFGGAGIFSGMSILTKVDEPAAQVHSVPSLAMEPVKPMTKIEPPLPVPPELKLDAVIYNSPQDWVVWINGEKHVPGIIKNHLTLLDVSPQSVEVQWQNGKVEQQITLNLVKPAL
ncbi:MAG: hypothetical protein EB059_00320 [Alphaproteobacteria bacterium]|nr:hypothetical protein [Alphaproteobacteria bacterium]